MTGSLILKQRWVKLPHFNELVDAHSERKEAVEWIKAKLADLQDRSRLNNLKIRGTPETIKQHWDYFVKLMSHILPDAPTTELIVNRIHRLPKPPHLSDKFSRDTIVCIHFYHIKNASWATRHTASIPKQYSWSCIFCISVQMHTTSKRKKRSHNHQAPTKPQYTV